MILQLYFLLSPFVTRPKYQWKSSYTKKYADKLVSEQHPQPKTKDLNRPVFILAHGFGASPFEWNETQQYLESNTSAHVSNVYLGGHSTLDDFSQATWQDWLQPIIDEYKRIVELGFKSIYLGGCSTGGTLILQGLMQEMFPHVACIKHIFFVDILLYPQSTLLNKLPYIHRFTYDQHIPLDHTEKKHWLPYRPTTSLFALLEFITLSKKTLHTRLCLPASLGISLFYASNDPVVNPNSSRTVYNRLNRLIHYCKLHGVESHQHVFTRQKGRLSTSKLDSENQMEFFSHLTAVLNNEHLTEEKDNVQPD